MKNHLLKLFIALLFLGSCADDDKDSLPLPEPDFFPINDTLIVNPHLYSPLTALAQHATNTETRAVITIKGKDLNSSDFIHSINEYKRNHIISILGLYPNFNNTVVISYYDRSNNLVEEEIHNIQTDSANFSIPTIEVDVANEAEMEPGFHFLSYRGNDDPHIPFMFDNEGHIRWYLDFSEHPILSKLIYDNGIEKLKNGNYYFGNRDNHRIYEVSVFGEVINSWGMGKYLFHHNVFEKENGNFIITAEDPESTHLNGSSIEEDFAIEIDRNSGAIVTEWDLKESLDENRIALTDNRADWFHGNAIIEADDNSSIIISGRVQGFFKIDRNNRPVWLLSTHRDWDSTRTGVDLKPFLLTPLDANGNEIRDTSVLNGWVNHPDFEWPWYGHAPLYMPNGNLMVFDNGDKRNYTGAVKYSRAVEYKIDEQNMTIQQVWSYGKFRGIETYSRVVSDVDYYPNTNNILFSPGFGVENGNGTGGKLVELDYTTKEIVFEARITVPGNIAFNRAERETLY